MALSPAVQDLINALADIAAANLNREAEQQCSKSKTPIPPRLVLAASKACQKIKVDARHALLSTLATQPTANVKRR